MEFLFVCSFFLVVVVIDMFGFCFKEKAKDMFSKIGKCKNSLGWFFLFFFHLRNLITKEKYDDLYVKNHAMKILNN